MQISATLLLELGVILTVLTVLGSAARRLGLSPIPLYLLVGLALGDGGFAPIPAAGEFISRRGIDRRGPLAAGIGSGVLDRRVRQQPAQTPAVGVGGSHTQRDARSDRGLAARPRRVGILALAGVTYISSSGVIARLLSDLHRLGNRETPAVLSILVLEDFAMAAYLPLLAVLAAGGTWWQATLGMAFAVAALAVAFVASYRWGHHLGRILAHPDNEQLLLRIMGLTLVVAALAELVHASAAVGAFLVGLTLTGEAADRARIVLSPLRDLFAAIFFLAIGFYVDPADLVPMLPAALALAAVTALTKILTGQFAARREGVARPGQLRAGTALIARGAVLTRHHRVGRDVDRTDRRCRDSLRFHPRDSWADVDPLQWR